MPSSSSRSGHHHRRRRRRRHRRRSSIGPIAVLATLAVAGFLFLVLTGLVQGRRDLLLARGNLSAARVALSQRDDAGAKARLDRAAGQLASAKASASVLPLRLLAPVPLLGSPARALSAAAKAGTEGLAAGRVIAEASASFPTSASATVDGHDLRAFHEAASRSQAGVEAANRHLASAAATLAGPAGAALPPVSRPAKAMRAEIEEGRRELAGLTRALALLRDLTGPETEARILVLSQDTLELRPTGGFIGSYGILRFSRGTAELERFEATEDLPDPSPPLRAPPSLADYLPRAWNLSNANWSPDFPTSAGYAVDLYRRHGGGEVDGVMALTELATARLVGALGSLKLPSYAIPVVEEGFETRAVYEVEKIPYDVPRKKFLIELSDVLFARLFDLSADQLPGVANAVQRSLSAGDMQLWFKDPARQSLLAGAEATGDLPDTPPASDFLMVVDANMTASKANLETTKQVDYTVERRADGRLVAHVKVLVRNDGVQSRINPFYNSFFESTPRPAPSSSDQTVWPYVSYPGTGRSRSSPRSSSSNPRPRAPSPSTISSHPPLAIRIISSPGCARSAPRETSSTRPSAINGRRWPPIAEPCRSGRIRDTCALSPWQPFGSLAQTALGRPRSESDQTSGTPALPRHPAASQMVHRRGGDRRRYHCRRLVQPAHPYLPGHGPGAASPERPD